MKIIITGAAGFIGSCLLWKLNSLGVDDITVVDHLGSGDKWKNLVGKRFEDFIEKDEFLDILSSERIEEPEMIIHLGACTSTTETDATYLIENNYIYSKCLASFCLKKEIPFLYASSAATYGDGRDGYNDSDEILAKLKPLNMYGFSKHLFDLWLLRNKLTLKVTGFKFFNVYGPNEYHKADMRSLICKSFHEARDTGKIRLFKSYRKEYADGQQKRDFIYVKDAIEAVNYFIEHPGKKGIYNIGSGKARSWNDLAKALFSALNMKPGIEYSEMPEQIREKYQYFTEADLKKLESSGFKPEFRSLEEGVADYVPYLDKGEYL